MKDILEIFSPDFLFANALWASLLMGLFCPMIGRHLVFGRTILLGLAIPQISLAGIAFVFLGAGLGWSWCFMFKTDFSKALIGSLVFTIPTLLIFALPLKRRMELSEGWLAFLYLSALASIQLMFSHRAVGESYIEDLFHGRMVLVSNLSLKVLAFVLLGAALCSMVFRRKISLVLSDREFARSLRLKMISWDVFLALLNGIVIGVAVAITGPVVTFGLLVLPVMGASLIAKSLRSHAIWTTIFGLLMGLLGFVASYHYDLPLGACVVTVGSIEVLGLQLAKYLHIPRL
jgi:ABC-type Mn2+/Zn2+ transport system permease subunit